jgi:hypothetical protein
VRLAARSAGGPAAAAAAPGAGAIAFTALSEVELAALDLIALAVEPAEVPLLAGRIGAEVSDRCGVLMLASTEDDALGAADYLGRRVRARAVGALFPSHAAPHWLAEGSSVMLASPDRGFAGQAEDALERGGIEVRPAATGARPGLVGRLARRAA